ncbi:zinc-binding alcohol dehydrogenase [Bifidobacterium actinocoloniiforme DSM 22766]|uniref:Zinc-binding alcohol dehydrogenase n=1 Tax=Bifidobacterium actinocoloniiforme DSM 22766 TaxID=1437605 RepID=A0A086Z058_9BIFI|nr:Zn-dependent alcohol dehydrogenase [Bifidobacterium actinocoloniiforme]AKV55169.1 molecular chaperone GroES [Bifidobacterium actinocoloniiforme DSM 22766]KFI39908.1 zinc-binding alcohol dehydrogenase [Bifidobacterium actinocoloniiforme DSM 22766]
MRAARFIEPGQVRLDEVDDPVIEKPGDAIIRIVRACVCGSDLWWFRGLSKRQPGTLVGHEAIGVVEAVGQQVTHIHEEDFVIAPFTHGCGHCPACVAGFDGNCMNQEPGGNGGYQGERLRFSNADWALIKIPGAPADYSDGMLNSLLTLADVMATGYHAAVTAEVSRGDTVVVFGDGAVGLCGVIAAKLRGAERIIAMSRHADRQALAREFGATDILPQRGDEAVEAIRALSDGAGADAVLECVGSEQSVASALGAAKPGAVVGRVGVPQDSTVNTAGLFWRNVGVRGGVAAVTSYDKAQLLDAVLDGRIQPGKVFTQRFDLEHIQQAYEAMDQRKAVKSLLVVSDE